jgi:hypothetical protein
MATINKDLLDMVKAVSRDAAQEGYISEPSYVKLWSLEISRAAYVVTPRYPQSIQRGTSETIHGVSMLQTAAIALIDSRKAFQKTCVSSCTLIYDRGRALP